MGEFEIIVEAQTIDGVECFVGTCPQLPNIRVVKDSYMDAVCEVSHLIIW